MSNRYVWQRYNIALALFVDNSRWSGESVTGPPVTILMTTNSDDLSPKGDDWPREAQINSGAGSTETIDDLQGQCVVPPNTYFSVKGTTFSYGKVYYSRDASISCTLTQSMMNPASVSVNFNPYVGHAVYNGSKGTANGTVSNSASSTYPPQNYPSKSARIWPYSAPGMRGSGRASTSMYPLLGAALTI